MPLGSRVWNPGWLAQNAQRAYPLAEDATRRDRTGTFALPDDFLVELDLPVSAGVAADPAQFFVMNVGAYATGYAVVVGYQPAAGGAAIPAATALVAAATHVPNADYALGGTGAFADTIGKVTIGRLDAIARQPPGSWDFAFGATRLDPDSIRPIIQGVAALICVNGDQESAPLRGDVALVAGRNCQLSIVAADGADVAIRVDFVDGAGSTADCACDGTAAVTAPLMTINGIGPDAGGNFNLAGSACVGVDPVANGVRIGDTCSQPCCGCPELTTVTAALLRLQQQAETVAAFVAQLSASTGAMETTVLGSKVSDRPCGTCA